MDMMFKRLKLKLKKGSAKRSSAESATNSTPNRELSQLIDRGRLISRLFVFHFLLLDGPDPETAGYILDKANIKKLPKLHRAAWKGKWEKLDRQLMRSRSSCHKVDKQKRLDLSTLFIFMIHSLFDSFFYFDCMFVLTTSEVCVVI